MGRGSDEQANGDQTPRRDSGRQKLGTPRPLSAVEVGDTIHFDPFMSMPGESYRVSRFSYDEEEIGGVRFRTKTAHFKGGGTIPVSSESDNEEPGVMVPDGEDQLERISKPGEPGAIGG